MTTTKIPGINAENVNSKPIPWLPKNGIAAMRPPMIGSLTNVVMKPNLNARMSKPEIKAKITWPRPAIIPISSTLMYGFFLNKQRMH